MRYLLIFLLFTSQIFADCLFRVVNYSLYPVKIQAGFYRGESAVFTVPNSGINSVLVHGDNECLNSSLDGSGVVYANLIGGKSSGGWRYVPQNSMIRAMGQSMKSDDFVIGTDANGHKVSLYNNYVPKNSVFEVQIKPSQFRDTPFVSSSN